MTGETPFRVGGVSAGRSGCAQPEDTTPWRTEFPPQCVPKRSFSGEIVGPRRRSTASVFRLLVRVLVPRDERGEGVGGIEDFLG